MGRKFPFEYRPDSHSEAEDWYNNYEFQNDWYPWAKQTMRFSTHRFHSLWEEQYYLDRCFKHRGYRRCWKKYRFQQWK